MFKIQLCLYVYNVVNQVKEMSILKALITTTTFRGKKLELRQEEIFLQVVVTDVI